MSGFSNYSAVRTIDFWLQGNQLSSTPPANKFIALFFADPTDANITANEVSAPWYERQLCNAWNVTGSNVAANANQVLWDAVTGSAVTVTHYGIYDAETAGNLICSGPLSVSKLLNVSDIFTLGAGQLVLTFD